MGRAAGFQIPTYPQLRQDLHDKFGRLYSPGELDGIHRYWRSIGKRVASGSRIPDQRLERKKGPARKK